MSEHQLQSRRSQGSWNKQVRESFDKPPGTVTLTVASLWQGVPFQKAPAEGGDQRQAQDLSILFLQTPLISCIGTVQNKTEKVTTSTKGY